MRMKVISTLLLAVVLLAFPANAVSAAPATDGFLPLGLGEQHTYDGIPFMEWGWGLNAHITPDDTVLEHNRELQPRNASSIHILQCSVYATEVPNDVVVGHIVVYYDDDSSESIDLVMGVNTAEWAYDRPENQEYLAHNKIPPAYSYWTNIDSDYYYWGHHFYVSVDTDPTKTLASISLILDENTYDMEWFGIAVMALTLETPAPAISGGGWLQGDNKSSKRVFSFNAKYQGGQPWPSGHLNYSDKAAELKVKSNSLLKVVTSLETGRTYLFGLCTVNNIDGHTFIASVVDDGEPGIGKDHLWIRVTGPDVFFYEAEDFIAGGNIQVRE